MYEIIMLDAGAPMNADELEEISLAFCKECLGWSNAYLVDDFGYHYIKEPVSKDLADTTIFPYERQFHYLHFERIIARAEDWCRRNGWELLLDTATGVTIAPCNRGVDRRFIRCKVDGDPRCAVLSACVTAQREVIRRRD